MKTVLKWSFIVLFIVVVVIGATYIWKHEEKSDSPASLLSSERILNIAHRGASGYAPEHTLIAYESAQKMNADYLEIDLHMTADEELVAIHDEDVSRTTSGSGLVQDMSLAELKSLDAGSWFNIAYPKKADQYFVGIEVPTLAEILDSFGLHSNYYIEIKDPDSIMTDKFLSILEDYHLIEENKVIIQSFSEETLKQIHAQYESIPLIQLLYKDETKSANYNQIRQYATGVGVPYQELDEDLIQKIHEKDLHVHTYTVNEEEEMKQLVRWGVDGIFTDYPDRLAEILLNEI
ncbi:glycerophosphodiester phosphodiesterase [Gracilibacillus salitolerans]|uniref:Glycerophosphodiester phosphodiesterase n=1 Tax=Gracilibacillus salitolerans TaxID=2663022 RepID=A0A5Q2TFW4_9BACI|nr:glycerophosphodiester phosphodiesterase family protein [Gracilibacillus salitolerans]QGH32893.1 glycerophosphodiester phosphodiesterase [Gracilibacillus salitolerans]